MGANEDSPAAPPAVDSPTAAATVLPPTDISKKKGPKQYAPIVTPTREEIVMSEFMDSCITKFFLSGVVGGLAGAAFGMIFGSFSLEMTPGEELAKRTIMENMKLHAKDALSRASSYGRGFAAFGAVYAASECGVEKFRAKHDLYNPAYAGCLTGGILAVKQGPTAMAGGCAMVGAFSVAIDYYMGH